MKPFNYKKAREFLLLKEEKEKVFLEKRFDKACRDFKHITTQIISRYNPARIYQWGSLLNKERFSAISDIDIALEGVTLAEDIFAIYGLAMELTDFSVDIVQLEKIETEYADLIRNNGKLIYERS